MRSDIVKLGDSRAPHRSLLRATGLNDEDFKKPFIAICNSHVDVIPGHVHLDKVGQFVKECVREAGGVTDILAKSVGSRSSVNVVRAVFEGISEIMDARAVAHHRGKALKDMWG